MVNTRIPSLFLLEGKSPRNVKIHSVAHGDGLSLMHPASSDLTLEVDGGSRYNFEKIMRITIDPQIIWNLKCLIPTLQQILELCLFPRQQDQMDQWSLKSY
jgi:hypothetical protein